MGGNGSSGNSRERRERWSWENFRENWNSVVCRGAGGMAVWAVRGHGSISGSGGNGGRGGSGVPLGRGQDRPLVGRWRQGAGGGAVLADDGRCRWCRWCRQQRQ